MQGWQAQTHGEPGDVLELVEMAPLEPDRDQLTIEVSAANINFADILLCRGTYQERPGLPLTPGIEAAGRVIASGPDGPAVGTPVVGMCALPAGGFAEQAVLGAHAWFEIPHGVADDVASVLFTTYQTTHLALHHRARLQAGEWLLVHAAAGGVGSAAVQLGRAAGARVIATAGGADKVEFCRGLGADYVIDSTTDDVYATVMDITSGAGVDVAYDPVGGDLGDLTRRLMAWEGRLIPIGFAGGGPVAYPGNHLLVKNYTVVGLYWTSYLTAERRHVAEESFADLARLLRAGDIVPPRIEAVGLGDVPSALERLASRQVVGRLVVQP